MAGQRGRPKKPLPTHQNVVLSQAIKRGLSTAVTIQGRIRNSMTRHLHTSSQKIWRKALRRYHKSQKAGASNFSHITEAENNIRKNGLQMLFEKAAAYGNTEAQRVKSSDDTVGPLNQRFNIGGANLREFAMIMYPFQQPEELPSGERGYVQTSRGPEVVPIHAIPELDFIDCVRQHVQVLNTHCFIYDVSLKDTGRYTNLFLLRVRPYLNRIYTENRIGLKNFKSGTLKLLQELKADISKHYPVRVSVQETVTSRYQIEEPKFSTVFFECQLTEAKNAGIPPIFTNELERILYGGSIDQGENTTLPCLTDNDSRHIWMTIMKLSRKSGSRVHRQLLSQFPRIWNIKRAILNSGNIESEDGYILCSEVKIETDAGTGRADLVLLRREVTRNGHRIVWRPVLVLDVKTKTGFNWSLNYKEKESESRDKHNLEQRVVADFKVRQRLLSDFEWKSIISSVPNNMVLDQVETYARAIEKTYEDVVEEPSPTLPTGILYIDANEDIRTLRDIMRSYVIGVYESLPKNDENYPRTLYTLKEFPTNHASIVIFPYKVSDTSSLITAVPPYQPLFDPLKGAFYMKRRFILYLSAKSSVSGGRSAAWISRYWHGFEEIHRLSDGLGRPKIIWLDLADEFSEPILAKARFRLGPSNQSSGERFQTLSEDIRQTFDSIQVQGLFNEIRNCLSGKSDIVSFNIPRDFEQPILIVVSGWDWIRNSTPSHNHNRTSEVLSKILDQIPDSKNICVLWFDIPVPSESSSEVYSSQQVYPFYTNSPLNGEVTDIVWNLPCAPRSAIWSDEWKLPFKSVSPAYDEIRVIIRQDRSGISSELTQIPSIIGWSQKIRAERARFSKKVTSEIVEMSVPDLDSRKRISELGLDLISWIFNLYPKQFEKQKKAIEVQEISQKTLNDTSHEEPEILNRLTFRPTSVHSGKSFIDFSGGKINSQRLYKKSPQLKTKPFDAASPQILSIKKTKSIVFGQAVILEESDSHTEMFVCQDPRNIGCFLIGLFTESTISHESGFSRMDNDVTRLERVLRFEPEYIDTKPLIIEKSDNDILCWTWNIANLGWEFLGHIKLISRHKGRIALLDALKVTSDSFEGINPPEIAYPPDFEEKAWMVINRFYILRKQIIPVEISLKQKGSGCIISFTDSENYTTIHEVEIESVPDAITTLRAGYLFQTTIDNFMTWNVYHDIEYGDFEALKPLVETSTALRTRTKIPSLLQNMLEPEDDRIKLVLTHDESNCPVVKRGMKKHDSCWIIISHEDNMLDLSDIPSPLNGEQVYATLASGKIYSGSQKYSFDLELIPEYGNSAFSVFQEDRWILRLLREQGMNLIGMPVGSFIVSKEEKWKVVVNVEKTHLTWVLISETTGRQYGDGLVLIQFSTLDSIDDIVEATTEQILSHMTQDDLVDFELFPNKLRSLLTSKGLK